MSIEWSSLTAGDHGRVRKMVLGAGLVWALIGLAATVTASTTGTLLSSLLVLVLGLAILAWGLVTRTRAGHPRS